MRRILITSLLLTPMLFTASAVASHPGTDAAAPTQNLRTTTGVSAPVVLSSTSIEPLPNAQILPAGSKVLLSLKIDEQGRPNDIRVVNPINPFLERNVVNAVSKFRFQPAMLDERAVPVDLNLTVEIAK